MNNYSNRHNGTRVWDWPENSGGTGYEGYTWGYLKLKKTGMPKQFNFVDDYTECPGAYDDECHHDMGRYRRQVEALLADATVERPLCQIFGMEMIEMTQASLDVELARHGC